MPRYHCAAFDCSANSSKFEKLHKYPWMTNVRFVSFPHKILQYDLRCKWIAACRREKTWTPNVYSRLCSLHFEEGNLPRACDWRHNFAPTLFRYNNWGRERTSTQPEQVAAPGHKNCVNVNSQTRKPSPVHQGGQTEMVLDSMCVQTQQLQSKLDDKQSLKRSSMVDDVHKHNKGKPAYEMLENDPDWAPSLLLGQRDPETDAAEEDEKVYENPQSDVCSVDCETLQTEEKESQLCSQDDDGFSAEIYTFWEENQELRRQVSSDDFFVDGDDEKVRTFTGLPCLPTFMRILSDLEPLWSSRDKSLSKFQKLLLTFFRLRLGLSEHLLAHLFLVSPAAVFRVISETVSLLYSLLKHAITWPDRGALRKSTPQQFVEAFGNRGTLIIDCCELLLEVPQRGQMSLTSKRAPSLKYLTVLTPGGEICFLSQGWGGRVTDRAISRHCTFVQSLEPGDVVVSPGDVELNNLLCAEVKLSAFTNGILELGDRVVVESAPLSHLIKMVTGRVREKYKILSTSLPLSLVKQCAGEKVTLLDKILTVCCVFTNLSPNVQ